MNRIRLRSIKLLLLGLLSIQGFAPVRNTPTKLGRQNNFSSQRSKPQQQCPRQRGSELYFLGTDGGILGVGAPEVVSVRLEKLVWTHDMNLHLFVLPMYHLWEAPVCNWNTLAPNAPAIKSQSCAHISPSLNNITGTHPSSRVFRPRPLRTLQTRKRNW